jgi:hypothetical protein
LTGANVGQVRVKDVVASFSEFDTTPLGLVFGTVEKTQLDTFGMFGEKRKANPFAIPICPEWLGFSWPNAQLHPSSYLRER